MDPLSDSAARILEIETRQDDALRQLEALERRIEQVLAEHLPPLAAAPLRSSSAAFAPRELAPAASKAA